MNIHKEISFETEICDHLAAHGWLYAGGDHSYYDRTRALYPPELIAWVQESQTKAWETLTKSARRPRCAAERGGAARAAAEVPRHPR
jgi:type I restriction enzyme R subunit